MAPFPTDRQTLERECVLSFVRGSGPGGQHRNKVETGVRLVHPPSGVTVVATDQRSQHQNREAAFERLIAKLERRNHVPRKRVATKPTKGSQKRRLTAKKQHGDRKRDRRGGSDD